MVTAPGEDVPAAEDGEAGDELAGPGVLELDDPGELETEGLALALPWWTLQ